MLIRCLAAAFLLAALLPRPAQANPVTLSMPIVDGALAASLAVTPPLGAPMAICEMALRTGDATLAFPAASLQSLGPGRSQLQRGECESQTGRGSQTRRVNDDGGSLTMFSLGGNGQGWRLALGQLGLGGSAWGQSPRTILDALDDGSSVQGAALNRSAAFAGGSAVIALANSNSPLIILLFNGIGGPPGLVIALRAADGTGSLLTRLGAEDGVGTTHTPEPTSLLLIGTGLAGLAAARRRRQGATENSATEG